MSHPADRAFLSDVRIGSLAPLYLLLVAIVMMAGFARMSALEWLLPDCPLFQPLVSRRGWPFRLQV